LQKYVNRLGIEHGYSPHPMRVTCITTALEHGVTLDDRQRVVGHAALSLTQRYDRRH
jgi:site-specific recombinase XerD